VLPASLKKLFLSPKPQRIFAALHSFAVHPLMQRRKMNAMLETPISVLLVDDEKDFVDLLGLKLREVGTNVAEAYDGRECLQKLKEEMVDVVLLDIKMPGMDGIDVLKGIKDLHPLVEVIMLTGHGTIETAVEGMKLGAFDYLLKPADFNELLIKLKAARKRKQEQEDRIRKAEHAVLLRESRKRGRRPFSL
jgi:DNA-binding NtrC family response regulator